MSDIPVGETLRLARQQRELTIAQVNQQTKISAEVLRQLEADDHAAFESETYLKGFLRSYAEFLELDPGLLWAQVKRARAGAGGGSDTVWNVESGPVEEKVGTPRLLRFIVPILLLVIALLVVLLLRKP